VSVALYAVYRYGGITFSSLHFHVSITVRTASLHCSWHCSCRSIILFCDIEAAFFSFSFVFV